MGFAIPTSFLLCFVLLAIMGISISNIVMFGLILAVGMLVDGAIVVTELADRKMAEGLDRRAAYSEAARRMAWPLIASTATTLAAFMPLVPDASNGRNGVFSQTSTPATMDSAVSIS